MLQHSESNVCPLLITADHPNQSLTEWTSRHLNRINQDLYEHKALLFRDFENSGGLDQIAVGFFEKRLTYIYRSTPRSNLGQYIYTATEYPRQLSIPQHCENAYQRSWPMKLLFHCVQPATKGGRTPLGDTQKITEGIDPAVRDEFFRKGVKYVRNYRAGVDLPWEEVFGTNSRQEVEKFCREQKITVEWREDGLRTSQVCQAIAQHPVSGVSLWFNQAHLFHLSALDENAQKMMLSFFGEEGLPRNAYFGDGTAIPTDMLNHIRAVYEENLILFEWQKDDVLLIDNMLVSHGREPYEGERRVLVCMAEAFSPDGVIPPVRSEQREVVKLHV